MFSRPILIVIYIYIYTDHFLCWHTDTASTPDATEISILNKFSSRANASDFQCWKSIYPLLTLPHRRGERRSRLLSNGRCHESASSRALWKKEKAALFLGVPCERPKSLSTLDATKWRLPIIWTLCQYVINGTRHQFTSGDLSCRTASGVVSHTASLIIMSSIVFCRVVLLVSSVDMVKATQMHVNTEFHSLPLLFVPEMTHARNCQNACLCKYPCKKQLLMS